MREMGLTLFPLLGSRFIYEYSLRSIKVLLEGVVAVFVPLELP